MCPSQKKRCYASRSHAIKAALSSSRKRGTPLRVYWHHQCKSYHLTRAARIDNHNSTRELTA